MQNIPLLNLSVTEISSVSKKMARVLREPLYTYPWASLEEDLRRRGLSELPLVAYGSLVNFVSSVQTLDEESTSRRRPVIAFGVRRLFNYNMPSAVGRYSTATNSIARAALNVRLTGDINDVVNGILLEVLLRDIPAMRSREEGYDLVPVACIGWKRMDEPPFLAYILRCPDELRDGKRLIKDKIEPHLEYYLLCRKGAAEFGEEFLHYWLATAYLADGVTTGERWETIELAEIGHQEAPQEQS